MSLPCLESDDLVAVKVRERLGERSLFDVAADLEKCLNLSEEGDRIYAVKNFLAGSVRSGRSTRNASHDNDEIELLDLAESLLEKLAEIKLYSGSRITKVHYKPLAAVGLLLLLYFIYLRTAIKLYNND